MPTPSPSLAVIGGTSLLNASWLHQAERISLDTDFGARTLLRTGSLLFLQRHGLDRYTPPHAIDHRANLVAQRAAGAQRILAVGSVGSLHPEIPPGRWVIPDDFYAPQVNPTFHDDARGHRTPEFTPAWRQEIIRVWQELALPAPHLGGVYWQTVGPRFETPAEIRAHRPFCQVVGMTVAAECILSAELEIPYAAICMVDNLANGIAGDALSLAGFKEQVQANQAEVDATLTRLLQGLSHVPGP